MVFNTETIPDGYKQTKVGVIPEDWDVEILRFVLAKGRLGGNYPNQNNASAFPLMKMGNLSRGHFDISKVEYISSNVVPEDQHLLEKGDVLFNTRNTLDLVGKVAIWLNELPIAYYNSNLMRLEFNPNKVVSNEYANFALNSLGTVARLRSLATGTTSVAAIYTRDLMELEFIVPTKPEQRSIATALRDTYVCIDGLDKLIAKKRNIKQGTMQELLTGKARLPGFSGGWNDAILLSLIDPYRSIRYGIVQPGDFDQNGRYMIRGQDYSLAKGWAAPSEVFKVSDKVEEKYKNARVKTGDLIMTIVGYCGHVEEIPDWLNGANLTQTTVRIAIHSAKANNRYCRYALMSEYCQKQVGYFLKGAAQPGLNCADVEKFVLQIPSSIEEQEAIAEVLSDMDAEIAALEQRLEKAKAIKQGMMQQLLTGRIRLVEPSTLGEASA